jgi:hypothetical protein
MSMSARSIRHASSHLTTATARPLELATRVELLDQQARSRAAPTTAALVREVDRAAIAVARHPPATTLLAINRRGRVSGAICRHGVLANDPI